MLTIEIPEVNTRKSAEDELAQYILNKIETKGAAYFKYYTSDQNNSETTVGDWVESTGDWYGEYGGQHHKSSLDAVLVVISAFRKKGYLIKNQFTFAHCNQVTILK